MHAPRPDLSSMDRRLAAPHLPTREQSEAALREAGRLYRRGLTGWVGDLLTLRRDRRLEPVWSEPLPAAA